MIPLKDLTSRRSFPAVTFFLIAANIAVFIYQLPPSCHRGNVRQNIWPGSLENPIGASRPTLQYAAGASAALHLHVLARRIFAHSRQYVVPLDFWRQRRGPAGLARLSFILHRLRSGLRSRASGLLMGLAHTPSIGASGAISGVLGAPTSCSFLHQGSSLWFRSLSFSSWREFPQSFSSACGLLCSSSAAWILSARTLPQPPAAWPGGLTWVVSR